MTLKTSRWLVLAGFCLLLMGFAGTSYGAVRFDVAAGPTEVINTGRSEVLGSARLIVRGTGNVTGTSLGGDVQIAFIYTNPAVQIDNDEDSGIALYYSPGFVSAAPSILVVENREINGRCTGYISINLKAGATPVEGDYIVLDGVRGRIDASLAITPGTDLYVDLQSINDPAATTFTPDRTRVAKSLDGMNVEIEPDNLLLCFPPYGKAPGAEALAYYIEISEGFQRAFVDDDAADDGSKTNDRVDTGTALLGDPTNPTWFAVWLEQIPASVDDVVFEEAVYFPEGSTAATSSSSLVLESAVFDATSGTALAYYSFQSKHQTNLSDTQVESFKLKPIIELKEGNTTTGTIMAAVSLAPAVSCASGCKAPDADKDRPRFLEIWESEDVTTNNQGCDQDDALAPYAQIIRCNCYLLFTYVVADSAPNGFNTGIAIANTTGDKAVFGDNEAADQIGKITLYWYDKAAGYVGSKEAPGGEVKVGRSLVALATQLLPSGVTKFEGYVIAKSDFQFCHGVGYISDSSFAAVAQGYPALVIPDPAIKHLGGQRSATAAADVVLRLPAGAGLNN